MFNFLISLRWSISKKGVLGIILVLAGIATIGTTITKKKVEEIKTSNNVPNTSMIFFFNY